MATLNERLEGLFDVILARYKSGSSMSSATKGNERELFVSEILKNVFPSHFRFSSGDIVDTKKRQSGQVDIVLEKPIGYSFPQIQNGPRLFLAENVAAVVEVKSDLQRQWNEVLNSSAKVSKLHRSYSSELFTEILLGVALDRVKLETEEEKNKIMAGLAQQINSPENVGNTRIPYFVVGFKGWKKDATIVKKLRTDRIDGIFVLENKKFVTTIGRAKGSEVVSGNKSLMAFLHLLEIGFAEQPNRPPAYSRYF